MTENSMRPDVEAFVSRENALSGPRLYELPIPVARRIARRRALETDLPVGPLAIDRCFSVPSASGENIRVRLFDSRGERDAGPVVVYFHGGGWMLGDADIYAPVCAEMARQLDLPVVSIDYRRAPEHVLPAGMLDCEAAARWVASNPEALQMRATSLVLAGDSCGGAYMISTAMALRDAPAAAPVVAQLAFYPSADLATRYDSFKQFATGYLLDKHIMRWFAENAQPDDSDYRSSPMAGDVTGLPPAVVVTAALDPLRDQGRAYAAALKNAGVPVIAQEVEGMVHAFIGLRRVIPSAQDDFASALSALKALITP